MTEIEEAARKFVERAEEFPFDWPNAMSDDAYKAYEELRTLLGVPDGAAAQRKEWRDR